jgi:hypothetical protein
VSISALEKIPLPELFTKFDTTDFTVNIPIQMDIIGF